MSCNTAKGTVWPECPPGPGEGGGGGEGPIVGLFLFGNAYELEPNPDVTALLDQSARTLIGSAGTWKLYSVTDEIPAGYYCNGAVTNDGVTMGYCNELRDGRFWDGSIRKILGNCCKELIDFSAWGAAVEPAGRVDRLQFWQVGGEVVGIGSNDELFYHSWDGNAFASIDPQIDIDRFRSREFGVSFDGTKARVELFAGDDNGACRVLDGGATADWIVPKSNITVTASSIVVSQTQPNTDRDWTGLGNECYPPCTQSQEGNGGKIHCLDTGLFTIEFNATGGPGFDATLFLCDTGGDQIGPDHEFQNSTPVRATPITLDRCYVFCAVQNYSPFTTRWYGVYGGVVTELTALLEQPLKDVGRGGVNENSQIRYWLPEESDFMLTVALRPRADTIEPCTGEGIPGEPGTEWGDCPTDQASSWGGCAASVVTAWPTDCSQQVATDWPPDCPQPIGTEWPIPEPPEPPLPTNPIGDLLITQFCPEEMALNDRRLLCTQFVLDEITALRTSRYVTQFCVAELIDASSLYP